MSKFKLLAVVGLAIMISGSAYSAPRGAGGRGGGGGVHIGGGGGARFGGMRGGGARFGGGGVRRFSGRPAVARSRARPSFRGNRSFTVRNNPGSNNPSSLANRKATINAERNPGAPSGP